MKHIMRKLAAIFMVCLCIAAGAPVVYAQEQENTDAGEEYKTAFAVVDITDMDITGLQQAVDDGYLTYEQIMHLYLDRINAYADMYECLIYVSDTALDEARECDRVYRETGRTSDVFGLPVIVKDNINVSGMPTTNGAGYLSGSIATEDADIVAKLKACGAIIVAKSNMDTYAEHSQYSISDFGRVNNAFDLSKTSYGSSGGSAVSSAASLAPICVGTDTNASIRVPSAANGVVGIRPTKGLLSTYGVTSLITDRDTAGPIARTVKDAAIILSAMTGYETDYTEALDEGALSGMRIGIVDNLAGRASGIVPTLFYDAVSVLEEQGAEVVHVTMTLGSSSDCNVAAYNQIFTAQMDSYDLDLVIYPNLNSEALTHEAAVYGGNSNGWYISPSAGVPAITVPMGTDYSGVPSGIEFVGRSYEEELVLSAAYAYEQASGVSVKTTLAPNLYDSVAEIEELFELRDEGMIKEEAACGGMSDRYGLVEEAYSEAVSYLDTEYYTDAGAAATAGELLENYENAVSWYRAGCWQFMEAESAQVEKIKAMLRRFGISVNMENEDKELAVLR